MSKAKTDLEMLQELKSTCTTDKELIKLYEKLIDDAMLFKSGDIFEAISDEHFESMNHNPSEGDL